MKIIFTKTILLIFITGLVMNSCNSKVDKETSTEMVYKNANARINDRVKDLMSRMTIEQKVYQMDQYVGLEHMNKAKKRMSKKDLANNDAHAFYPGLKSTDVAILVEEGKIGSFLHVLTLKEANYLQSLAMKSELQIPLLIGIDAIHGNGLNYGATIYPTPIGIASTWDNTIAERMSLETAAEMRATGSHWAFTPNIDIARDARWGRVGETFGEDPLLVSNMGVAMINGLQQGDFTGTEKVVACAKHLIGGGESVNGTNAAPLDISMRTIREMHLPSYKKAIQEANVYSIMTAHNEVNGIPCHKDKNMMTDIVRNEFGFKGFYVSDWMDIERIYSLHHTSETLDDAFIESVNAGMDMHMHGPKFADAIIKAVKNGMIPESRIDEACSKILTAKFRLGLFENPYVDEKIKEKVVFNQTHQATALDAARNSIVLLKNNGLLPLKENKYKRIFITGPNADNETILGDWALQQPQDRIITIKEGFEKISEQKNFTLDYFDSGRIIGRTTGKAIETATSRAKKSDLAIIVVGENSLRFESETKTCGENTDRSEINLHGKQLKLIQEIKKTGVPVIVVLVNGRPISEPWIDENIPAVLEAWEPGSFGGQAIAEIIFGEVNPSGKLPITFPRSSGQISLYYNHKPSHFFHKYKFTDYTPLYSFGYGLSYTSFKLTNLEISKESISPDENFTVKVNVKNTGKITGQEVVQLYIRDNYSSVTRPVKELKAYKKIKLNPNTDEIVEFELTAQDLAFYNAEMQWGVEKGDFTIMIGNSSRDEDLQKVNLHVNTTKLLKY
jgi:beta-glucosidase